MRVHSTKHPSGELCKQKVRMAVWLVQRSDCYRSSFLLRVTKHVYECTVEQTTNHESGYIISMWIMSEHSCLKKTIHVCTFSYFYFLLFV